MLWHHLIPIKFPKLGIEPVLSQLIILQNTDIQVHLMELLDLIKALRLSCLKGKFSYRNDMAVALVQFWWEKTKYYKVVGSNRGTGY